MNLKEYIRTVDGFPKAGISFKDISPLLGDGKALNYTIEQLANMSKEADVIVGPDARGFLFATPVAAKLAKPMVMVRKPGKLPGPVIQKKYELEYGSNTLEIQEGAIKPGQKVIIIDDLLATGGTTRAAIELIKEMGAEVIKVLFVIELVDLNGREKYKGIQTESLIKY